MVFLIPSINEICGLHPKDFILEISSNFLGVPLGLDLSHLIKPS